MNAWTVWANTTALDSDVYARTHACVLLLGLQRLPLNDSLILEAVRSLHHDMSNMIVAAQRCAAVEAEASQQQHPQTGGCANILLDDVVADYAKAFTT